MGRFVHEAIAVDPRSSIVYETEDVRRNASNPEAQPGSGFYRFIPTTPQRLADGGRLQVLAVRGNERMNLTTNQRVGVSLPVRWLDIADPDPAAAERDSSSVFREAHTRGAASFDRLEGCFWADDSCYFVSTNGGTARAGQVWRYVPEGADGGSLSLVFESPSRAVLDAPDNICVSSRGGVIICEDGSAEQYVRALNRTGEMIDLVLQPQIAGESDPTEFAGSCYSPDGEILFFNVQGSTTSYGTRSGSTYALWGEWGIGYGV
jgi:secreted PhoX family phosphatase